jgi:broad-specificity NMP kinase
VRQRSWQLKGTALSSASASFETEQRNVGIKNYLIDGVSCAGKTTVCTELQRRGYHTIHGDRELAYWGDPTTGEPVHSNTGALRAWMWNVATVRALVADHTHAATFFCGGSRNTDRFIGLFDKVFVLEIDLDTLNRRLAARPEHAWGGTAREGEAFARLQHETKEGLPKNAIIIDATAPLSSVVDMILEHVNEVSPEESRDSGARSWPKAYTGESNDV